MPVLWALEEGAHDRSQKQVLASLARTKSHGPCSSPYLRERMDEGVKGARTTGDLKQDAMYLALLERVDG